MNSIKFLLALSSFVFASASYSQSFYFGSDLSYVNEMEDCGAKYRENGVVKDVYEIFAYNGCNLVRLRLWHTPSWYDNLNSSKRYSDFQDVRKSIMRAKAAGMKVLLDFHLSDNWADPDKQRVPAAWSGVVGNLPVLKDSLYNYIYATLSSLNNDGLLPDMVQIGNETNKGILLSAQEDASGWVLDWNRNAQLFNAGIKAVRDVSAASGKPVKVALHIAGPKDVVWFMGEFWKNNVRDFDLIGISYYWAWHKPINIKGAGDVIAQLKSTYPNKDVMIFETGYIWTTQSNDNANNIISEVHPDYSPASPENQRKWLIDLTQEVFNRGGKGVIYWEPAWVSTNCRTQWGQGSHQEHATFFDFSTNVLPNGGMGWMKYKYTGLVNSPEQPVYNLEFIVFSEPNHRTIYITTKNDAAFENFKVCLYDTLGTQVFCDKFSKPGRSIKISLPLLASGAYFVVLTGNENYLGLQKIFIQQ
jgi:arabinogalactan endo-1,4-beta-galactosidase